MTHAVVENVLFKVLLNVHVPPVTAREEDND